MKLILVLLLILGCSAQEKRAPSSKTPCICTMDYNPVCGIDGKTYANACAAKCENIEYTPGECKKHCACTREFVPVCGSDGRSYPNECSAKCAGVDFKDGECQ